MSETAHKAIHHATYDDDYVQDTEVTGWIGWVGFAGFMMILEGVFQAIAGLVALFRDTFYAVSTNQILVVSNVRTWGWINLILGSLIIMAGIALFSGSTWARVIAVLMATSAAIINMVEIPLYPIWALLGLTISILVIYAVIVHGRELKQE
jgi:hypothetical protein